MPGKRSAEALDARSCGPRAGVRSERLDLNMELDTFGVDFGLSDLARTHEKQRKGSIRQFNAWRPYEAVGPTPKQV